MKIPESYKLLESSESHQILKNIYINLNDVLLFIVFKIRKFQIKVELNEMYNQFLFYSKN